jgi:hypothetical protein
MTTTDVQKGAVAAAPQTNDSDAGPDKAQRAESAANELLAKARYDAFKLVTDARTEAESVLDEARAEADGIVKQATMTAESLHDAAKLQADELLTSANAEHDAAHETRPSTEPVETTEALEAEHEELTQRVGSLRSVADQLEVRFAALADAADRGGSNISSDEPVDPPASAIDYSPSVPSPSVDPEPAEVEERGSFYTRRSANLPSIGDAASQSALEMMRAIRSSSERRET